MKLAICDDEAYELSKTSSYLREYIKSHGLDLEVICFSDAKSLLEYDNTKKEIIIYILDVIMPEMNGIELGRELHKRNRDSVIIYLTASEQFSISAFSVRAFSYLLKPIEKEKLFSELDELFETIKIPVQRLMLKTSDGTINLSLNDIMAVEYFDHRLIYHLKDKLSFEGLYQKQSFEKQAAEFVKSGLFVKVSASHLINMANVRLITASAFIMIDDSEYTITRKYSDSKKKYIEFAMKN